MHCSDAIGKLMMVQQKAHKGDRRRAAVCLCTKLLALGVWDTAHTDLLLCSCRC